jgi:capsular exopolysaccharide synthesis family protein
MTTVPATIQERLSLPPSSRARGAEGAASLTASDIISMLRRRVVLIAILFLLLSAMAVGAFFLAYTKFPKYSAESLIECISNIPETELQIVGTRPNAAEHERFVLSEATFLKSPRILQAALAVTEVRDTAWYKSVKEGEHLRELEDALNVGPIRGTNYLRVAIATRSPADPHVIVRHVVNRWLEAVRKRAGDAYANQRDSAKNEKTRLDGLIAQKRNRLNELSAQLPGGATYEFNLAGQQVLEYGRQVAALQLELAQLEQFRSIYNDPEGVALTQEDIQLIEADPRIQNLTQQINALRQQRAADSATYGAEHVEVRQIDARIDVIAAEVDELRTQRTMERRNAAREVANTAYYNTQHALFAAQDRLQKAEAGLHDQDRMLYEFQNLRGEIEQDVQYRIRLEDYISNLDRLVDQKTALKVDVAQEPIPPIERSFPSLLVLPAGIFMALAMAIGLALALELMDTTVRTTQDIARHVEVAILGAVPDIDDEEITIDRVETAVRDAPRSMVAEAFRRIRTNLQFSAPASRQRAIMVTSPNPEDGKTTIACNVAMVVAQSGRRVLLVDANFRRPGIDRIFSDHRGPGLSNILVGEGSLTQFTRPSGVPMLDILGSGPIPPNPAELLGSEMFGSFLEDAISRYDQVIIDSAPVLLASDAVVISTAVDGVIMVVRARQNSRGVARRACALLQGVNAHLFGAVLNAAQVTRGGYFREQFRTYYDYQVEGDEQAKALPDKPAGKSDSVDRAGRPTE